MKRLQVIKILRKHGCVLVREGSKHTVFLNSENNKTSTVPRHNEVDDLLVKKIFKDLGIKEKNRV